MSDAIEEQAQSGSVSQNNQETNIKDLTDSLRDAMNVIETQKSQISGLDKKVTDLSGVLDKKSEEVENTKISKMSEIDKLTLSMQDLKNQTAQERNFRIKAENKTFVLESFKGDDFKDLDSNMLEFIDYSNTDTLQEQIDKIKAIYNSQKEKLAVNFASRQGGTLPNAPSSIGKKKFSDMSMSERNSLAKDNPDLYRQMRDNK